MSELSERNPSSKYDTQEEYVLIRESVGTLPTSCGCSVIGLITLYDCHGNVIGLVTPNDAEAYKNGTVEVPVGFVKCFHPVTGEYLGILTIEQSEEYINFLLGLS
jgi:hypothetical protein